MANDPTGRVLQLLSLLQTHRMWSGPELADRLEVSARTLRRDIDRLRELGYPVEAAPGVDGGYRLAAGTHMPPLVLDDDEAVAIAVGLRAAAGAAIGGMEDTSVRALAKLEQVLPDRLRRRVSAVHGAIATLQWAAASGPTVDPDAMGVLAQACRDHEEVRFDYQRRDGETARRLVEPHQLVSAGRRWYLAAWDRRRDDWRTFRLDRLSDAQLAGSRFEPRPLPGGDAAAYVARSISSMPRAFETTVRVESSTDDIAGVLRWADADVEQSGRAWCRLRLRADSVDRLVSTISAIALTADVAVESPPEIAAAAATLGRRLRGGDADGR
jgi:predicted DNA-binding transcriptional regulator YafY